MMVNIPLLTADDIDCRVQSVAKNKKGDVGAILLLYKNARVDMRILDEVFGVFGWQRKHNLINDNLFCTISIWNKETAQWINKEDVGVESNTEKEKGEASDSFKRAGTNIGIGRELYTSPFIYITLEDGEWDTFNDTKNNKIIYRCTKFVKFSVKNVEYNERREIIGLNITDSKGNARYSMGGVTKPFKTFKPIKKEESAEPISATQSQFVTQKELNYIAGMIKTAGESGVDNYKSALEKRNIKSKTEIPMNEVSTIVTEILKGVGK